MRPQVAFSITTAENGWIVRRIDSYSEGAHGDYVFNSITRAMVFLTKELEVIAEVRERVLTR